MNKILNKEFNWVDAPSQFKIEEELLEIVAERNTDYFNDPRNGKNPMKIPMLISRADDVFQFETKIKSELKNDYDAGSIVIYSNKNCWAKLCLEISPIKEIIVVSVVTNHQKSDDCVHEEIKDKEIYLRICGLEHGIFTFHSSVDRKFWRFLRYFKLNGDEFKIGFSSQCPHGNSNKTSFSEFNYRLEKLEDMRNGK